MTARLAPAAGHQSGSVDIAISAASSGSILVTFPMAYAGTAPNVVCSANSSFWNASPQTTSTTAVILGVRHIDATSTTGTITVKWTADPS